MLKLKWLRCIFLSSQSCLAKAPCWWLLCNLRGRRKRSVWQCQLSAHYQQLILLNWHYLAADAHARRVKIESRGYFAWVPGFSLQIVIMFKTHSPWLSIQFILQHPQDLWSGVESIMELYLREGLPIDRAPQFPCWRPGWLQHTRRREKQNADAADVKEGSVMYCK